MRELDSKAAHVLNYLSTLNTPVSAGKVAEHIGLTPRSIHYRLPQIAAWVGDYGLKLVVKPHFGLFIEGPPEKKRQIKKYITSNIYFSPVERIYIILLQLLSSSDATIINQLAFLLSVSRSTIAKDFNRVEVWLSDHGLTLKSKPNYGFWIEGKENDFRDAILSCMINGSHEFGIHNEFMRFCFADAEKEVFKDSFGKLISDYFKPVDLHYLNNLLNTIIDIRLSDRAQFFLILHLAIQIVRLQSGKSLNTICPGLGDLKQLHEFYWSEFIASKISETLKSSLGIEEISYITRYLRDAQAIRPMFCDSSSLQNIDESDRILIGAVDSFLCQLSRRLHPSLITDRELRNNLALHLKYSLDRSGIEHIPDNPVIQDIKNEYNRIFGVVSECISESKLNDLNYHEDEIGYITIHIAAALERLRYNEKNNKVVLIVCNAGTASAILLRSRIFSEFSNITIDGVISYNELLRRTDFSGIDLIISTIPLNLKKAPPVLVVNVLLKDHDVENLKKILVVYKSDNPRLPSVSVEDGPRLPALIDNNLIGLQLEAKNWSEAADLAGRLLYRSNLVEFRYIESMKEVVKEFGPYMVAWPGIALLHSNCSAGANQPGISIITLRNPIPFGHPENDPVDIVIALSIPVGFSFPLALDQLNNLLTCDEALGRIRSSSRRSTVMMWIKKFGQESSLPPI